MTGADIRIRTAKPEDVPGIAALSDALFREDAGSRDSTMNLKWAVQEGRGYFADLLADAAAACWLAEHASGGEAVGYLAGRLVEADCLRTVRVATLESMYVRETFRGTAWERGWSSGFCRGRGGGRRGGPRSLLTPLMTGPCDSTRGKASPRRT